MDDERLVGLFEGLNRGIRRLPRWLRTMLLIFGLWRAHRDFL